MVNWKLFLGQSYNDWRQFFQRRRTFQSIPPGPPILVTGAYRSGTTWVGNMLSAPGVWHLHEPFNPTKGLWPENFSYLRTDQPNSRIDSLITALLQGQLIRAGDQGLLKGIATDRRLSPVRLGLYPMAPRRVLIKDPIACLLSAYLNQRFDFQTLVIFRHPAGFVESLKRLGWNTAKELQAFLGRPELMEDWLEPYRPLLIAHGQTPDICSAAVLHGCLSRVMWGFVQTSSTMEALLFEQLCSDPFEEFQSLFARLNLPYSEAVIQRHQRLTSGVNGKTEYRPHDTIRDSSAMPYRWKTLLSSAEIATIRNIWQQFDIPLYDHDQDW